MIIGRNAKGRSKPIRKLYEASLSSLRNNHQTNQMKITITLPLEEYNRLKANDEMLDRISDEINLYKFDAAQSPNMAVIRMKEMIRTLTAKIQEYKEKEKEQQTETVTAPPFTLSANSSERFRDVLINHFGNITSINTVMRSIAALIHMQQRHE